jgi:hypothetical protein
MGRQTVRQVCFLEQQYGNNTSNYDAEQAALFGNTTVSTRPTGAGFKSFRSLKNPKFTAAKYLTTARKYTLLTTDDRAKATHLVRDLHM